MNFAIWYLLFIVLFAAYYQRRRRMRQIVHKHMMNKRKGVSNMNELIKAYIGKDVIISTGFTSVDGILVKVEDNWAQLETKSGIKTVNLEYVSVVQEYPCKKNGKKSSVRALFGE